MKPSTIKQLPKPQPATAVEDAFGLIGNSENMLQVREIIEQVAPTNISVLIIGESGSGKEIVARAVYEKSRRKSHPFITVNCAAIPEGLLESELFGHEKGAFTGAAGLRKGYFELADGGTIFLDEIGEMPLKTQTKLLRVLEGGQFMRVGGSETKTVDVRVITATNRHLEDDVEKGDFRHDLFFRLNAIKIQVPPLRERTDDIQQLALRFANAFSRENHIDFKGFDNSAFYALENYHWPGNVRELKNTIEKVIVLEKGEQITQTSLVRHLPQNTGFNRAMPIPLKKSPEQAERELIYTALLDLKHEISQLRQLILERLFPSKQLTNHSTSFVSPYHYPVEEEVIPKEEVEPKTMAEMERNLIFDALNRVGGSKRKAAKALRISERTLYRKIKEYDLPF